jgi:hypothetical protein
MALLTNSNCAALIGGSSAAGQTAVTEAVVGQLFGNPNQLIQFNAGPDSSVPQNAYAVTGPAQVPTNIPPFGPHLQSGAQITLGLNFYNPPVNAVLPPGGVTQNQMNTILEEFGHAEGYLTGLGYSTNSTGIVEDSTTLSSASIQNIQNVSTDCDQGGNVPTQTSQVDGTIQ